MLGTEDLDYLPVLALETWNFSLFIVFIHCPIFFNLLLVHRKFFIPRSGWIRGQERFDSERADWGGEEVQGGRIQHPGGHLCCWGGSGHWRGGSDRPLWCGQVSDQIGAEVSSVQLISLIFCQIRGWNLNVLIILMKIFYIIDTIGVLKSTLVSGWVMFVKINGCSTSHHLAII